MIAIALIIGLVAIVLAALVRLARGPTLYDRLLGVVCANIALAAVIAAAGVLGSTLVLIDLAIVQVGIGFLIAVTAFKALRFRSGQPGLEVLGEDERP